MNSAEGVCSRGMDTDRRGRDRGIIESVGAVGELWSSLTDTSGDSEGGAAGEGSAVVSTSKDCSKTEGKDGCFDGERHD